MSDRRSSRGKVRLDAELKAGIIENNAAGMSPEEIADKFDIHAEYVRRIVKKAMADSQSEAEIRNHHEFHNSFCCTDTLGTAVELADRESLVRASPRSNKKQKICPPVDNENRTPRGSRSAKKRKPESESEAVESGHDVEMADVNEITLTVPQPSRKSLSRSLAAAAVSRNDQSGFVAPQTAHASLSPFKSEISHAATQTKQMVVYDQAYIDFLEESQSQALRSKDQELAEKQKKILSLSQQVQRLEADLKKEREKAGFERGWKKHF